ncbi:MAG: GTPase HflX [Holophagales bacterium]|nr:GTPase HflX [Holophagales bacterium]MXX63149.1 GTPase HflX [Holophagales bacterium]MYC08892.1 GTPase HflX [Holophagales bacterium]MYD20991.1 GTPase HflX [Holophagales bacterium]MYI33249.1 GTPase HflX [Holophagales bacterium]
MRPIHGDVRGLRAAQRGALERTYRRKVSPDQVVSTELARHLCTLSREIGRQVGVLLTRDGAVSKVIVGDARQLEIPDIGRLRGGPGRFRRLRLVHTHLRGEGLSTDDLNDLALLRLDLVAVVQAEADGSAGAIEVAYLAPSAAGATAPEAAGDDGAGAEAPFLRVEAPQVYELDLDFAATIREVEREFGRYRGGREATKERALVIGVRPEDDHFAETVELVRSAGVEVAGRLRQRRSRVHPRTVVGRGKLTDIVLQSMRAGAEVAIFDIDLKPAQARAFEDATGLKAIDRTQLILDVFAQRARSRDGKLQVELAQLRYSLPRLTEKDAGLSRLAGGIGGRGPGETVLEVGRRRIRDRIRNLERQVEKLSRQRDVARSRRRDRRVPVLSLIGYTNAGKSTLLNALTRSEVETAGKLFVTLDPTSRRIRFPREGEVVITDTVGFIAELPPDLVRAFRATLEELGDADLLLHVVDAADAGWRAKVEAVERLIEELSLNSKPLLVVLNKCDLVTEEHAGRMAGQLEAVAVSARTRAGFGRLIDRAEEAMGRAAPLLPGGRLGRGAAAAR